MSLRDESEKKIIKDHIENELGLRLHNLALFEIFEGDLLKYILQDLQRQLSANSYEQISHRVAPVNILIKMISKLSKIYSRPPKRTLVDEKDGDKALFEFYQDNMKPNNRFQCANEFYNLFKNSWVEPFVENGKPQMRSIPSHQFTVLSLDQINPLRPTHLIKYMGMREKKVGKDGSVFVEIYWVYTDKEFAIFDSDMELQVDMMNELKQDGRNPYGTLPGVYINKSNHKLIPLKDSDTLQMTKLIPILMSDLNFAVMFQAFSIIYGIDLNDENLSYSPSAFWRFKTDKQSAGDTKPEIGVIKPEVQIQAVLELIKFEISVWLQSKNIKPGEIGKMSAEDFASGISKMIDEMDTSEDRQHQVPTFIDAEEEFWQKVFNNFHPFWAKNKFIDNTTSFSQQVSINVEFHEQRPNTNRKEVIDEQKSEVEARFTTRKRAIQRLNPDMTDEEIDTLISEIDEENTIDLGGGNGNDGGHVHNGPDGNVTGPAVNNSDGTHYHLLAGGEKTGNAEDSPGHTHSTAQGSTGPAIEQAPSGPNE